MGSFVAVAVCFHTLPVPASVTANGALRLTGAPACFYTTRWPFPFSPRALAESSRFEEDTESREQRGRRQRKRSPSRGDGGGDGGGRETV